MSGQQQQQQHVNVKKDINAIDCDWDGGRAVICGNDLLEVYRVNEEPEHARFTLCSSLYSKKRVNWQDVSWSKVGGGDSADVVAVGAANTDVAIKKVAEARILNLQTYSNQMERSVNSVQFHHSQKDILLAASQAEVAVFDLRVERPVFHHKSVVKTAQWDPHHNLQFAACVENCLWICDIALASQEEQLKKRFPAHNGPVVCCDWHPKRPGVIASGGRDSYIKVWDLNTIAQNGGGGGGGGGPPVSHSISVPDHLQMLSVECVYSVKWRPNQPDHLCSTSSQGSGILVWNINRPFVPAFYFEGTPTIRVNQLCFHRKGSKDFLSVSADRVLRYHSYAEKQSPESCTTDFMVRLSNMDDVAAVSRHRDDSEYMLSSRAPSAFSAGNPQYQSHLQLLSPGGGGGGPMRQLRHCLRNYSFNSDTPSESCRRNSIVAASVGLARVSEAWEMLSHIVTDKDDKAKKSSGNATYSDFSSSGTQLPDSRDPYTKLSTAHNFDDSMTRTWQKAGAVAAAEQVMSGESYQQNQSLSMEPYQYRHDLQSDTAAFTDNATETEDEQLYSFTFSSNQAVSGPIALRAAATSAVSPAAAAAAAAAPHLQFDFTDTVYSLLLWMVDSGELQFAISALIVLQRVLRLPTCETVLSIREWIIAYHDLLSSMALHVEACCVVKDFPLQALRDRVNRLEREAWERARDQVRKAGADKLPPPPLDQYETVEEAGAAAAATAAALASEFQEDAILDTSSNTTIKVQCCGSTFENRCRKCFSCALCSYCRRPVRTLYAWCQGCGHGGHLGHMYQWFHKQTKCPEISCEHECEYS